MLQRYLQIQGAFVLMALCMVGVAKAFPGQALWILGKGYDNLQAEFVLTIIGSCLSLIAGASFTLSTFKGWIIHPAISIAVEVGAIILGLVCIDISSLKGVLYFNIFVACIQIALYIFYCLKKIQSTTLSK
jgi:hypothetical protein